MEPVSRYVRLVFVRDCTFASMALIVATMPVLALSAPAIAEETTEAKQTSLPVADDMLGTCTSHAVGLLGRSGAHPLGTTHRDFGLSGSSHLYPSPVHQDPTGAMGREDLTREPPPQTTGAPGGGYAGRSSSGCVAVLVVGHTGIRDLDVELLSDGGVRLEQDLRVGPEAYATFCGNGLGLHALVSVVDGQGEFTVTWLRNGPTSMPNFNAALGECFGGLGGLRAELPDLGPENATTAGWDRALDEKADHWKQAGYRTRGAIKRGRVNAGQTYRWSIRARAGKCYLAHLATPPGTMAAVRFLDPGTGESAGQPTRTSGSLSLGTEARVCPLRNRSLEIAVAAATVAPFAVQLFQGDPFRAKDVFPMTAGYSPNPSGATESPGELDSGAPAMAMESVHRFQAMEMDRIGTQQVQGRSSLWLDVPVRWEHKACYGVTFVPSKGSTWPRLELQLTDANGSVLATRVADGAPAWLYHCLGANGEVGADTNGARASERRRLSTKVHLRLRSLGGDLPGWLAWGTGEQP